MSHHLKTLIIDEIQKYPPLIPTIKQRVDEDTRPGQFLLTGSSDLMAHPEISESLAGRVKHLRLRPMTIGETEGNAPASLDKLFKGEFPNPIKGFTQHRILHLAFRGEYPEVLHLSLEDRKEWHQDHINSLITKDLKDILNIRRQDKLTDLLTLLASWSSKFMNLDETGNRLSPTKNTLETYLHLLQDGQSSRLENRPPPSEFRQIRKDF